MTNKQISNNLFPVIPDLIGNLYTYIVDSHFHGNDKNKLRNAFVYLFIGLSILFVALPNPASAEVGLGVYPPILQIEVNPPTSLEAPFTIQNTGNDPVDVHISFRPFRPKTNGQIDLLPEGTTIAGNDPSIFDKMEIKIDEVPGTDLTLAPQQEKQLFFHMLLPKDEPPGDYYFSILIASKDNNLAEKSSSGIIGGVAMNVLLSIGPQDKTTGNITEFHTPFFVQHGPIPFTLQIENTSDHFIVPKGYVIIKNMFGQNVGRIPLLQVNILSNSKRFVPDNADLTTLDSITWPEKFLLGLYSAHLSIALSDAGPLFERTIYFFALPWQLAIGIGVIILIVGIIVVRVRKRLRKD